MKTFLLLCLFVSTYALAQHTGPYDSEYSPYGYEIGNYDDVVGIENARYVQLYCSEAQRAMTIKYPADAKIKHICMTCNLKNKKLVNALNKVRMIGPQWEAVTAKYYNLCQRGL